MLEKLMNSPIAWTVLSLIAIAGFIYAIVCQCRNKEKKEFSYSLKTNHLIRKKKSKFEKLHIAYDGQKIENLCVSKFVIWNSGNRTLNDVDMVETKELTIATSNESKILDCELVLSSEKTNNFSIEKIDEHTIKILFKYVDKKDGIIVQVIHTGYEEDIQIDCKIKGGKPIKNTDNETVSNTIKNISNRMHFLEKPILILIGIMISITILLSIVSVIAIFDINLQRVLFSPNQSLQDCQAISITLAIVFGKYSLIMSILYISLIKKRFGIGIPSVLKKEF